jgi:alkylated DNA repair protein alkB family protein 7
MRACAALVRAPYALPENFGVRVLPEFFSHAEEEALDTFCSALLRKRPWETHHFDSVITNYRETQAALSRLCAPGAGVVARALREFPPQGPRVGAPMDALHALELSPQGSIGAHVDSVKFSGGVVAGLSLRSDALMVLTVDEGAAAEGRAPTAAAWAAAAATAAAAGAPAPAPAPAPAVTILLPRRSLYLLTGEARFGWAHALPLWGCFEGRGVVARDPARGRLSIILRDQLPA